MLSLHLVARKGAQWTNPFRHAGGGGLLLYWNHEAFNAAELFQYANLGGNAEFEAAVGRPIDYYYGYNNNNYYYYCCYYYYY